MSILISCCFHALVDHRIMPNFPFYLFPISSDCWNFTTSKRPSSRHFPISAQTSFASSIVRQSEIFTDKAIPESKLSYTWVKYRHFFSTTIYTWIMCFPFQLTLMSLSECQDMYWPSPARVLVTLLCVHRGKSIDTFLQPQSISESCSFLFS